MEPAIAAILDRRLRRRGERPIALALSGGGDSVALLLAVTTWAGRTGRRLLVLNVDHGLRPQSADWAKVCAARAQALGHDFTALKWTGDKPTTGVPAAARAARHRLLADAARAAGARVILMGHTADDLMEAEAMRAAGSTTPSPREWSPSPVWPQGRGLFLLRPMLALRRGSIRDWLTARGERWIEDPANDDLTYARARARQGLASEGAASAAGIPPIGDLARACRSDTVGVLTIPRETLRNGSPESATRFAAVACLCAAGTDRPPPAARALGLAQRLRGAEAFTATLAGGRIEADALEVRFLREAGEATRGGLQSLSVEKGVAAWDGRFEIAVDRPAAVHALGGLMAGLSDLERAALRAVAPSARPTLPVVVFEDGAPGPAQVTPLALPRLWAAAGLIEAEEA